MLRDTGAAYEETDLNQKMSMAQLDHLIGARDHLQFLNRRNELYRERGLKENPPSRAEALRLMAEHPNLIKRPILTRGRELVLGFDESAIRALAQKS